jgi:hypothetical protein
VAQEVQRSASCDGGGHVGTRLAAARSTLATPFPLSDTINDESIQPLLNPHLHPPGTSSANRQQALTPTLQALKPSIPQGPCGTKRQTNRRGNGAGTKKTIAKPLNPNPLKPQKPKTMATQHGPIKLKGTIGDLTFYRNSDGTFGAKAKTSITKERIATDPAFVRTRENGQEFASAGKACRLVRLAFQSMIKGADKQVTGRLQRTLMKCLKADSTSPRGARTVATGSLSFLQGFDFNVSGKIATTLLAPYACNINRTTGQNTLTVQPFNPSVSLSAPQGATHFEIEAATTEVDFTSDVYTTHKAASGVLSIDNSLTSLLTMQLNVTANSTLPLLTVLAVHFYQEVNLQYYALNNGGFDATSIINVNV